MPKKQRRTELMLSTTNLPAPVRLEDIQKSLQGSEELTPMQRRRLLKQFFKMKLQLRQKQFDTALELEQERLDRIKSVTKKQMIAQEEEITLHIKEEAVATMASLGVRATMAQMEFLADFGERLKAFRQKLAKRNIDSHEKKLILKLTKDEFERFYDKLAEITDGLVKPPRDKDEE